MWQLTNEKILKITDKYQHVIWDWNGTLVDDVDLAVDAVNVLLQESSLDSVNAVSYREIFGFPVKNYYEKLGFDFEQVPFEKLCDRFVEEYNHQRAPKATLFAGAKDLLQDIKAVKTQSILSAAAQWHLEEITKHFQIQDLFHFLYGINDHYASSKLARGHELIAASQVPKEKTILIGDTDHDFAVAQSLGVSCLLIADGHQSVERLRQFPAKYEVLHGRRSYF